jgi:hypothetical protein
MNGTADPPVDPVLVEVNAAVMLGQQGERGPAASALTAIWARLGPDGDPVHRCAVAHALADVQDDLHDELRWDQRALEAAEAITDERAAQAGVAFPVRAFYPSLHLNLGDVHRRLGNVDEARHHLDRARAAVDALGDDGYSRMIRGGLDRLAERLAGREP